MNSELPCGCVMTSNEITFSKKIYEEDGRIIKDTIYVSHRYKNFVNICGKCGFKEEMINKGENLKLKISKKQFDIFMGDDTDTRCYLECPYRELFKGALMMMSSDDRQMFLFEYDNDELIEKMIDEIEEEEDEEENRTREPESECENNDAEI